MPAPAGHLDRLELAARDPQRRVRLLARLGDDVAQREVEVLAVVLPALLPEHRHEAAHRVLPHRPLVAEAAVEGVQLGDAAALADAELDPAVAQQVERADPLGDPRRVVGRQLHDAVAEADVLGALAGRGEEHLGRRRVAVLLEEVVLDLPGVVVAEPVGQLDLVERVVEQRVLVVAAPRLGQLQLVEDPELHDPTPGLSLRYRCTRAPNLPVPPRSSRPGALAGRVARRRPLADLTRWRHRGDRPPRLEASCACTWARRQASARRSRCSTRRGVAASAAPMWSLVASTPAAGRTRSGNSTSSPRAPVARPSRHRRLADGAPAGRAGR